MATLTKNISRINIGSSAAKEIKISLVDKLRTIKQISILRGASLVRVYDEATYTFDVGNDIKFGVTGGSIDVSSRITSKIKHGDDSEENIAYSGNTIISVPVNYDLTKKSGSTSFTQNDSGLVESINWEQDADYVATYGNIVIDYFAYSDALVDGTSAKPNLIYHQLLTYASGRTETITSGATILYSGQYVSNNGNVTASAQTTETGRTQLTTSTVSISNGGKSATATCAVYQEANSIISISAYPVGYDYTINSEGETVQLLVTGTLKSGNTIDITSRCNWNSSSSSHITIETISGYVYATFGENEETVSQSYTITASLNRSSYCYNGDYNNDFDIRVISTSRMTFTQEASSGHYLYINMPTSQSNYYLGLSGGNVWCRGIVKTSGQIRFSDDALISWGELVARTTFYIYTAASSSAITNYTIELTPLEVSYITNKTQDVTVTASTN